MYRGSYSYFLIPPLLKAQQSEIEALKTLIIEQQKTIDDLQKLVQKQNEKIQLIMSKMESFETDQEEIESKENSKPDVIPGWIEDVKLGGDFRLRYDNIYDDSEDDYRNRLRIRVRLNLIAKVNDEIDLHFRLASGSNSPISTNQTLDDAFSSKSIWLDHAYFDYHPDWLEGLDIWGGKMNNPFYRPHGNQLIWDNDLNPEGIAVKYKKDFDPFEFFANTGGFYVDERRNGTNSALFGIQAGLKYNLEELDAYLSGGAGYYYFTNVEGYNCFYDSEDSYGNSAIPETAGAGDLIYLEEYHLTELFAELGLTLMDTPLSVFGDYVNNTAADNSDDTGWLAGFRINKCGKPGSWELSYDYRDLERDAVLGIFTDSDFINGGTGVKGHKLNAAYQISDGWMASVSYFINKMELDESEDDYRKFQLNLNYKF